MIRLFDTHKAMVFQKLGEFSISKATYNEVVQSNEPKTPAGEPKNEEQIELDRPICLSARIE